jgi:hypothetical protein
MEDPVTTNTNQQDVLSGPTIYHAGTSSVTMINSLAGAPAMRIDGGAQLGSFAVASYAYGASGATTAEFTVAPAAGASFAYGVVGNGATYAKRQLRLERIPGSTQLQVNAATGAALCGTLPSNTPTAVTVVIDPTPPATFDVLMDGASTECTNLPTTLQLPLTGFNMMDASNEGYGGLVTFTGLTMH